MSAPYIKSFGAFGNGSADDTKAINAAIAEVSPYGAEGALLLDGGFYYIGNPPIVIGSPISISRPGSPSYCYFCGPSGYTGPLFVVQNTTEWEFQHGGTFQGFGIKGNGACTGIQLVNTGTFKFLNMGFLGCGIGMDNVITVPPAGQSPAWSERIHVNSCTFTYNDIGIRMYNQAGPGTSYGYGRYLNLEFNTPPGGALFKFLDGPVFYSSKVEARGNMSGLSAQGVPDCLFDMTDGSGPSLYCEIDVTCETGGPSVGFLGPATAPPGKPQPTASVLALGHIIISNTGVVYQGNFRAFDLSNLTAGAWKGFGGSPLQVVTTFITKAVGSEVVPLAGTMCQNPYAQWLVVYAGGSPMNMASVKAVYNGNGTVTVTHPAIAGTELSVLAN